MAQAQPGPAQAQPGARFWKSGDLEIQKFGSQQIKQLKVFKIQIRSTQNIGNVWISREKMLLAPFGAISVYFLYGPEQMQKLKNKKHIIFSLVGQWALFTWFGVMCWSHSKADFCFKAMPHLEHAPRQHSSS